MEIGKKHLTDSEFSNLWAILYQEFYNLSVTNKCDATLVYNTIYIICTSGSSLEDKLYWKIGDFLYNRCKAHKDQVLQSTEYLAEYILRFEEYQRLVEGIHSLGSFLNGCIKGRKLNEFGYLLWDRMIIQNLKSSFFEDVLEYPGPVSKILESFERIVPDTNNKLLYYREKYEKIALSKIRGRHSQIFYSNIIEFCQVCKDIIDMERVFMCKYLLPCSYDAVQSVLEECLFSKKYYELLLNIVCFIDNTNIENITKTLGVQVNRCQEYMMSCTRCKNDEMDTEITFESASNLFRASGSIKLNDTAMNPADDTLRVNDGNFSQLSEDSFVIGSKKTSEIDSYDSLNPKRYEKARLFIENEFKINKTISSIQGWINKKRNGDSERYLPTDMYPFYNTLIESVGILDAGFILLKKAYSLYVEMIVRLNENILESTVKNVFLLFESLDIFTSTDCKSILNSIFKQHLQRSKPCFMRRLCDHIQEMIASSEMAVTNQKPFDQSINSRIFQTSINLISDKDEFMNMYQDALRDRIITGSCDLKTEYEILKYMNVPEDNKLFIMLDEIRESRKGLKILSGTNWNIEPVNHTFRMPNELIRRILEESPNINVYTGTDSLVDLHGRENGEEIKFRIGSATKNTVGDVRGSKVRGIVDSINNGCRIATRAPHHLGSEEKILQIAHQYSRIQLEINTKPIVVNIYQYAIIDMLMKDNETADSLMKRMKLAPELLKSILESLVLAGIIKYEDHSYQLDCSDVKSEDISKVVESKEEVPDVCVESYIQTLGTRVLKKIKKLDVESLVEEVRSVSRIEVPNEMIYQSISKLVEKGIAETKNNVIEFIF